jgi:DNA helicase-2/ATP-dependent DNA helicase PcrA
VETDRILAGLNPEQRRAVEAVRGPVCILAGAGSGKTTTITRRVANQVATGTFAPSQILAVTFTDKAAGEMKARLAGLGADGVAARTFHSAALGQLRHFAPDRVGKILASKALPLRHIGNSLPRPFRFRPAGDLATEIEWAKNRRIPPERYLDELGDHEPPIPHDLMVRVYRQYEARKAESGYTDFEDLLELAIRLFDEDQWALATVRERYRAFTVDEYQDVNVLQQTLLERWLGPRDDLCVVGDDYQSIYAFTGASPQHLLGMPARFPQATIVRLETNYRSSPQVLELANRLVPRLGGAEKVLRASRADGPEPAVRPFASGEAEGDFVIERIRALQSEDVPLEEIAILCRTNARLGDFEEPLHAAGIPFQGAALLSREAARMILKRLPRGSTEVAADVRRVAEELGWLDHPPERLGDRELTRQTDLRRFILLAAEFHDGSRTIADFVSDLERRFGSTGDARRGVHLLTLHGAKGLEFEAVFVPRVEERELPVKLAKTEPEIDEERRLFYVGLTRAKRHLTVTWTRRPSRFLAELGIESRRVEAPQPEGPEYEALRVWRLRRSKADDLPAYVIFHNTTLAEIAARGPTSLAELALVPGVGPSKLERYGDEVLAALRPLTAARDEPPGGRPGSSSPSVSLTGWRP